MVELTEDDTYRESDFPDLDFRDRVHLQRLYNLHGRDRVVGWLRAKVSLPLRLELADDVDEDAYYEAAADRYVEMATDRSDNGGGSLAPE